MAGGTGTLPVARRILFGNGYCDELSGEVAGSFGEIVFGFVEEEEEGVALGNRCRNGSSFCNFDDEEEEQSENTGEVAESTDFWEAKHQILQAILCRTTSLESRIRGVVKEAFRESYKLGRNNCACKRPINGGCRNCLLQQVSDHLRTAGINSTLCTSKWRKSSDILAGEHTYLEVVERQSGSEKGEMRVIVELDLRAEFEMARASEEYNRLINQIPEVFVGKEDRLLGLIKIMCSAAKKCMKEKKMHIGPWRKKKYMKAKWFGTCERTVSSMEIPTGQLIVQPPTKPKASMLTMDLLEILPSLQHCRAVEVV